MFYNVEILLHYIPFVCGITIFAVFLFCELRDKPTARANSRASLLPHFGIKGYSYRPNSEVTLILIKKVDTFEHIFPGEQLLFRCSQTVTGIIWIPIVLMRQVQNCFSIVSFLQIMNIRRKNKMSDSAKTFREKIKNWHMHSNSKNNEPAKNTSTPARKAFADRLKATPKGNGKPSSQPSRPKSSSTSSSEGGRDRGDDSTAPMSLGRSPDAKGGKTTLSSPSSHNGQGKGTSVTGLGSTGSSSGGHGQGSSVSGGHSGHGGSGSSGLGGGSSLGVGGFGAGEGHGGHGSGH